MRIGATIVGVGALLVGTAELGAVPAQRAGAAKGNRVEVAAAAHRSGRSGRVARPHHRSRPRVRVHVGGLWYRGWTPAWSLHLGPYGYPPAFGYTRVYPRVGARYGALDLDLRPERAEVWIDGKPIGVADQYDGFPDYLWLEEGTYDVVFYLPGRQTLARQYTIYPGLVIDVEDRLVEGESVHPLDLAPRSHVRRDERLRRERELRDRVEEERRDTRRRPVPPESRDARSEPGRLDFDVTPDDASVYLDGRLLGSAGELGNLRAGLLVDAGEHVLEIVRPGFRGLVMRVSVPAGEAEAVSVELDRE